MVTTSDLPSPDAKAAVAACAAWWSTLCSLKSLKPMPQSLRDIIALLAVPQRGSTPIPVCAYLRKVLSAAVLGFSIFLLLNL